MMYDGERILSDTGVDAADDEVVMSMHGIVGNVPHLTRRVVRYQADVHAVFNDRQSSYDFTNRPVGPLTSQACVYKAFELALLCIAEASSHSWQGSSGYAKRILDLGSNKAVTWVNPNSTIEEDWYNKDGVFVEKKKMLIRRRVQSQTTTLRGIYGSSNLDYEYALYNRDDVSILCVSDSFEQLLVTCGLHWANYRWYAIGMQRDYEYATKVAGIAATTYDSEVCNIENHHRLGVLIDHVKALPNFDEVNRVLTTTYRLDPIGNAWLALGVSLGLPYCEG